MTKYDKIFLKIILNFTQGFTQVFKKHLFFKFNKSKISIINNWCN